MLKNKALERYREAAKKAGKFRREYYATPEEHAQLALKLKSLREPKTC